VKRKAKLESQIAEFVIVGAGAAGAVLAARLSEDPDTRVTLLEAGGWDSGPLFEVPLSIAYDRRPSVHWNYTSEPQSELAGRRLAVPRGKALGGSTAINAQIYMRGLPSDYDGWAAEGLRGWGYDDVLPYFRRAENSKTTQSEYRGRCGPMCVSRAGIPNILLEVFLEAASTAGHPLTDDFAGEHPAGAGRFEHTIYQGRRYSTSRAYLWPILNRPNLHVVTRAHVLRLHFEHRRAVEVQTLIGGRSITFRATREIIVAAGAINSPQLLMLSGIGPAETLKNFGIQVVSELPGVGENFQDHLAVPVEYQVTRPVSLDAIKRADRAAAAFLQAYLFRTGPAAQVPMSGGGLFKSDPSLPIPDLQCHFMPLLQSSRLRIPFSGRNCSGQLAKQRPSAVSLRHA
jgi:choline dehydrogenase